MGRVVHFLLRSILPTAVTIEEGRLFVHPADIVVSSALSFGVYERFQTELFRRTVKPGMTVVDVGAHIGYYTVIAARRVGSGQVYAFEPDKENFSFLQKNIYANALRNALCHPYALGARDGAAPLYCSQHNRGDHRLWNFPTAYAMSNVIVRSIDALQECTILPERIDCIKIDVQGWEAAVLSGARRLMECQQPLIIFLEFWPEGLTASGADPVLFLKHLMAAGFEIFEINERAQREERVRDAVLFSRKYSGRQYINLLCIRGTYHF